jgi:hypothetical protein
LTRCPICSHEDRAIPTHGRPEPSSARKANVSQPRIAAIERSRNVTIEVLDHYVDALGATLEVNVVKGNRKISLVGHTPPRRRTKSASPGTISALVALRAKVWTLHPE